MSSRSHPLQVYSRLFFGRENTMVLYPSLIRMSGDHITALILTQSAYLTAESLERTPDRHGWFEAGVDFLESLVVTPDQLQYRSQVLESLGIQFHYTSYPRRRYMRVNFGLFQRAIEAFAAKHGTPTQARPGGTFPQMEDADAQSPDQSPENPVTVQSPESPVTVAGKSGDSAQESPATDTLYVVKKEDKKKRKKTPDTAANESTPGDVRSFVSESAEAQNINPPSQAPVSGKDAADNGNPPSQASVREKDTATREATAEPRESQGSAKGSARRAAAAPRLPTLHDLFGDKMLASLDEQLTPDGIARRTFRDVPPERLSALRDEAVRLSRDLPEKLSRPWRTVLIALLDRECGSNTPYTWESPAASGVFMPVVGARIRWNGEILTVVSVSSNFDPVTEIGLVEAESADGGTYNIRGAAWRTVRPA